ncbi:3-keto-disaccharide hydrolase [Sphingobacterium hungaricum]
MKEIACFILLFNMLIPSVFSQTFPITFGEEKAFSSMIDNSSKSEAIKWVDVNTTDTTWFKKGEVLVCKGWPIGVIRSEKMYENFVLHVEWRHLTAGGNSGIFVWSDAQPDPVGRLPGGVEVQMLELDWVNQHKVNGEPAPIAYVHGELFGVGGVKTIPDNPRGERSKSIQNLCLGKGEWNTYTVICVDGTIKLSVNGKFVNGISQSTIKKGYLCLEAEGAEIEFRNMQVVELNPGLLSASQIVKEL